MITGERKHLRLTETRTLNGGATKALRKVLREIETGRVVNLSVTTTHRDGSVYTFSQGEDPVKRLGALALLADDIKAEMKIFNP